MRHIVVAVLVALAYVALAFVSKLVAYSPADAWTVWLASGVVLGALLAAPRELWWGILAGGFAGALVFALYLEVSVVDAHGYGVIEVITAGAAALCVSKLTPLPLTLARPRELAVMIFAGALPLALIGALIATGWHVATGGKAAAATFELWVLSNFIGTLLVAPVIVAWSRFRVRRSGGMTMAQFAAGAVACALFLGSMHLLFDAKPDALGGMGESLTYGPIVFMALVALLWGAQGTTLTAFAGALIAMVNTAQGEGPFATGPSLLGDPELEVQMYALAIALTGLLIAALDAGQRRAMREAKAWQTRFDAAIGAHRMLAYEWDPASGRLVVTGDAGGLVGVPAERLTNLADWLSLVPAEDRDRVATRFDERVRGRGESDAMTYHVAGPGGTLLPVSDDARAIRDHDGQLHRVVGIARVASAAVAA